MMTDDDRLLEELRDLWMTDDPPPPGLVETMIAAVAAADLDDEFELLILVRDSRRRARRPGAGTRHRAGPLLPRRPGLDPRRGDRRRPGPRTAARLRRRPRARSRSCVETRDGQRWTSALDEVGFFALDAELTGSVRFTVPRRLGQSLVDQSAGIELSTLAPVSPRQGSGQSRSDGIRHRPASPWRHPTSESASFASYAATRQTGVRPYAATLARRPAAMRRWVELLSGAGSGVGLAQHLDRPDPGSES